VTTYACPLMETIEEAAEWFIAHDCTSWSLWRGPDGLIRGSGVGPDPSKPVVEGGDEPS